MEFREFLNAEPPTWNTKKKARNRKKDRRKFMSGAVTADDKSLDALVDDMEKNGFHFKKNKSDEMRKWLLERMEKIRKCLNLLSEDVQ